MDIFRFRFDYSFVACDNLRSQCITTEEIEEVFYNVSTFYDDFERSEEPFRHEAVCSSFVGRLIQAVPQFFQKRFNLL